MDSRPYEILLVEENEANVAIAERRFAQSGLPILLRAAKDCQEALDVVRRRGKHADAPVPDLVLLDLGRSAMNPDLLAQMRAELEPCSVPIVVVTDPAHEEKTREFRVLGASLYRVQPMTIEAIANFVIAVEQRWRTIRELQAKSSLPTGLSRARSKPRNLFGEGAGAPSYRDGLKQHRCATGPLPVYSNAILVAQSQRPTKTR